IYRISESDKFRKDLEKIYPDPPEYEDGDFLKEIDDTVSTLYESSSDGESKTNTKNKNRVTFSTSTTLKPIIPSPPPLPPKASGLNAFNSFKRPELINSQENSNITMTTSSNWYNTNPNNSSNTMNQNNSNLNSLFGINNQNSVLQPNYNTPLNSKLNNNNTFTSTSSSTSTNMNQNQNSNNNNNAPLTGVTKIKDGEPYYEIRNIKTSDRKFTLKGMPFTRKISNPDVWVTSHVKGPEFMQLGTALEIPTDIFFGTGYREIEDEETKEQKLKKAKQDYDTVMTKDANTWTANDQQKVTEYNKRLTEKQ